MTLWIPETLRARAGALAPVAERFLREWLGEGASSYGGGSSGLVSLCSHMEHWLTLDDVDEDAEHRFVEGAGALLGILLIEHVRDGAHAARGAVHRVRLGRHGFFDPFGAVDRALDSSSVRVELARQVALAEAEASGRGPISRVVVSLLGGIARERPDLSYHDQFDVALSLRMKSVPEPFEVDLARAVESTRHQGADAVREVTRKLLSMLPGAPQAPVSFDEVRGRIVPRLARTEDVRALEGQGTSALFTRPLTSELVIALLVEYDGRARYLRQREIDDWGVSAGEVLGVALENLAKRSEKARIAAMETEHGPLLVARTGDGRDSARVLLKSLYAALSARLGERVYVSVPHRDTFFACAANNRALVQELARRTAHDAERAPHRLSKRLFELTETGVIDS